MIPQSSLNSTSSRSRVSPTVQKFLSFKNQSYESRFIVVDYRRDCFTHNVSLECVVWEKVQIHSQKHHIHRDATVSDHTQICNGHTGGYTTQFKNT